MIQKGNNLIIKQQIQGNQIMNESNERQQKQKKQQSVFFQKEEILDYALQLEFKIDQTKKQIQKEKEEFTQTMINLLHMFDFQDVSESQIKEYLNNQIQEKGEKQIDYIDEIINLQTQYNQRPKNNIIKISLVDNGVKKKQEKIQTDDELKKHKKIKLNQENDFTQKGIISQNINILENDQVFNKDQLIQDRIDYCQNITNLNNHGNSYHESQKLPLNR